MTSCLGLYIEPNLIKYAKISKEHENIKIDSFGIKFYDKLGDAIEQIISDTYSYKVPISIKLTEEVYNYFYMFNLLSKNDLKKAINTEFETHCIEKGKNRNALESRYALVNCIEDKEKIKVIHVSADKNTMNVMKQNFSGYYVSTVSPIGISIANVAELKPKENIAIVNMEEKTTITTICEQKVYNVETIEEGSKIVLDNIKSKENSYSKAYEICKNATIYTMEGKELQDEENDYLEEIMPTLYQIAEKTKEKLSQSGLKIDRIYLTGTLSVVNNIDLYFQEFFKTIKCEIMKPFFIKNNAKNNIKDYIEINSAIALALQGLNYGIKDMNFQKKDLKSDMETLFSKQNTVKATTRINIADFFKMDLKEKLDGTERWMLRIAGGFLTIALVYSAFSIFLTNQMNEKKLEIAEVKQDTNNKIALVSEDINKAKRKTGEYEELSSNLVNISNQISENNKFKKIIPNLLTQLSSAIPRGVQITSVENTSGKHIVINAQSVKYEQLGIFKAIIKTQGILVPDTVVSSNAIKNGDIVQVVIEGDVL